MEPSFVLATPSDQPVLIALMRRLREDDPDEGAFDEAAALASIPALLSDSSVGRIWLIRAGQAVAGYVAMTLAYSIEFGGRVAFIDELFIEKEHRRHGIGWRAIEFVEQHARSIGVRLILLEVTCSNASAKSLYVKAGFVDRPHQLMTKRIV